jgi:hypothetical protein
MNTKTDEDYPGQQDEIRRNRLIEEAVKAGDRIILGGCDGSVEETDYLTAAVALKWHEKSALTATTKLLSKILDGRTKAP